MEDLNWMVFIVKLLHVVAAVILVGGAFFIALVFGPVASASEQGQALAAAVTKKWAMIMRIMIALLLGTGALRAWQVFTSGDIDPGAYHAIFGVKMIGAIAAFFLASLLVGKSQAFASLRTNPGMWRKLTALLGLGVILLGVLLSVMH